MAFIQRNPFLSRFSDRTGLTNASFLSMYAPHVIRKLLNIEHLLLPKATWLVGSPGAGKSSILRLFTIEILIEITKQKTTYSHIYEVLKDAMIIDDNIINYIGLYIQIDEFFAETANVNIQEINNKQLFCTLFDLRVAKQLLLSIEKLYNYKEATDPPVIKCISTDLMPPAIFSEDKTVAEFKIIIQEKEKLVAMVLNSFPGTPIPEKLELHNRFSSLDLINAQKNNNHANFILMIDDVHDLYIDQFEDASLFLEKRNSFPRWITTRKHVFPIEKLLGHKSGVTEGREILTLDLDHELKDKPLYNRFIKVLVGRRLKVSSILNEYSIEMIEGALQNEQTYSSKEFIPVIKEQKKEIKSCLKQFSYDIPEFSNYLKHKDYSPELGEIILIKAHRFLNKPDLSLFPEHDAKNNIDFSLDNISSKDKQAGVLFWKKRAKLPLYSGFDDILSISNNNVEHFLRVFSPFVDRLIYRVELNNHTIIQLNEQEKILKKIVSKYINNVILRLYHGDRVNQLIENLGNFFKLRTYEPNAPHAPGVTQFALSESDIKILENTKSSGITWHNDLLEILTTAIAHNILIPEKSSKQGAKGSELKYPFSLNRLICINYSLPLQKGDFQHLRLELLYKLCTRSFKPEKIKKMKSSRNLMN